MEELKKLKDKTWRVNNLYTIKDKSANLISFKRNRAQEDFAKNAHTRNIILKSRQLGFTTDEAISMLDDALFTPSMDSLFIAQDLDTAKDIFSNKITLAWDNYKLKALYEVNTESARQYKFGFGDGSKSSITVDSSGRSGTYQRLHITEFAKVCRDYPEKAKEIFTGSIPAVPTNGRVDIESTAMSSEGLFHDLFWEAWERGEPTLPTEFKAHFYNWQWDEEVQRTEVIKELPREMRDYQTLHKLTDQEISYFFIKWNSLNRDWKETKREYPTTPFEAFEGSGAKVFDWAAIERFVLQQGEKHGDWIYYDQPKIGNNYVLGADIAEGVGQDSSACVIWNLTPVRPRIVAIYKNNRIAPDLFAYEIKNGAEKYQMALVAPERNNHGHSTISKLKDIYQEENIYEDEKGKYGWETNLVSKPKMFFDLATAVNNDLVDVPSHLIASEMRKYDKENLSTNRFDENVTQHYDLLTAACIGFQMKNHRKKPQEATTYIPDWSDSKISSTIPESTTHVGF